ncbi:LysR family transcriptional regulator [Exiguobacterium sp. Helios]|uniref:LysR family transcriptional regulator n=1 Tax=Exiguobacterium sp. Helios TaxID=2735868 RepID=UPI00165E0EC9|nr:LysR family transcriptional regulator [Exiguobacterium sp. Helios]QNR20959.1 LysR family transcriptional regulator [Exiguobacterium sp. Helios]
MELLHLKYFRTVAEDLNFTHAAKRLFISQPALSMTIKKLERELQTELFHRNGRTITLTNQGLILLRSVEKIETELELVKERLANPQQDVTISLASSHGRFIQLLLAEFLMNPSSTLFNTEILSNREILSQLLSDEVHFSISFMEIKHPEITSEPVIEEDIVLTYPGHCTEQDVLRVLYDSETTKSFLFPSHNKDYNNFIKLKMTEFSLYADSIRYIDDVSLQIALRQQRYFSFVPVSVCRELQLPYVSKANLTIVSKIYLSRLSRGLTEEQQTVYDAIKQFFLREAASFVK